MSLVIPLAGQCLVLFALGLPGRRWSAQFDKAQYRAVYFRGPVSNYTSIAIMHGLSIIAGSHARAFSTSTLVDTRYSGHGTVAAVPRDGYRLRLRNPPSFLF